MAIPRKCDCHTRMAKADPSSLLPPAAVGARGAVAAAVPRIGSQVKNAGFQGPSPILGVFNSGISSSRGPCTAKLKCSRRVHA